MFSLTDDDNGGVGCERGWRGRDRGREREGNNVTGERKTQRVRDILERVIPGELRLPFLQDLYDVGLP